MTHSDIARSDCCLSKANATAHEQEKHVAPAETLPMTPPKAMPALLAASGTAKPAAGVFLLLDAARGIACLWVVLHHALGFIVETQPGISRSPAYALALNGAVGVWMFFVISGYCIANTAAASVATAKPGWVLARVRRIFPPCWFSILFCAASTLFAQLLVHLGILKSSHLADINLLHQTPLFYLANLTLTQELFHQQALQGVYWTLCYEAAFYAIVAMAMLLCRQTRNQRLLLNLLHALTLATLLGLLILPKRLPYPFDLWPHFGLGVLVYDLLRNGWKLRSLLFASASAAAVIIFICQHPVRATYLDRGGCGSFITSLTFALMLLCLHPFDRYLSRALPVRGIAWVGVFSYSLYLTHIIIIGYVYKACQLTHLIPRYLPVYVVLATGASTLFAYGFFQMCERPFLSKRKTAIDHSATAGPMHALQQPVS